MRMFVDWQTGCATVLADVIVFYRFSQALTSRKWTQKAQKLYLARYTHPLTLWHSHSAMCEYYVCVTCQHRLALLFFTVVKKGWFVLDWCLNSQPSWIRKIKIKLRKIKNSCAGAHIVSSVFFYLNLTSWHLSAEFLTSLWEMWTAAQGWGPPRPGEAGWAHLFQGCAFKHSSFQKSKVKAQY